MPWSARAPLHDGLSEPLEGRPGQWLGQNVGHLVVSRDVRQSEVALLEMVSHKVRSGLDVLGPLVEHSVLRYGNASLVVLAEGDRPDGMPKVLHEFLQPQDFLHRFSQGNVLGLCGGLSDNLLL